MATVLIRYAPGYSAPVRANEAHATLEKIRESAGGVLRASDVVEASRPADAPLHDVFTWDDAVAAGKHRENEARQLIRSIRVARPECPEAEPAPVYLHVRAEGNAQQYLPTAQVMSDADLRERALGEALAQLRAWRKRWAHLNELAQVFEAAEQVRTQPTLAAA